MDEQHINDNEEYYLKVTGKQYKRIVKLLENYEKHKAYVRSRYKPKSK